MSEKTRLSSLQLPTTCHGTAICAHGTGVLIVGPSGSGKSSLALQMMSLGARLISDDLVWLSQDDPKSDLTIAHPPSVNTPVQIEARSLGIITPPNTCGATALNVVLDMAVTQTRRLPETEYVEIGGQKLLYLHKVDNPSFPAMLMEYLRSMTGHST